ncbi:glycosyltransferase, partial [Neisseria gonorrhoeae]
CLNSIEPILSNENVELILVNDGSKDGSEDICYKYIDKTPNTKHQTPNIYIRITKDCRRREIPE